MATQRAKTTGSQGEIDLAIQHQRAGLNDRPSPAGATRQRPSASVDRYAYRCLPLR